MYHKRSSWNWAIWPWVVFILAGVFYSYTYFLRIIPSVMTSQLLTVYHLNAVTLGNLSGIYYYVYVPLQLLVGIFFDRFGPRRLLTLALLTCALGCYWFASADSVTAALLGRILMGFGSAFAFVGALKIASIWLPANQFAFITGITVSIGTLGGLVGDVLLTSFIDHHGWRLTIYGLALVGVVLGTFMFLLARLKQREHVLQKPKLLSTLREGCAGLFHLLRNPHVWVNCVVGCLLYIPMLGFAETWGIPYLMTAYHVSKAVAADAVSMVFLGWVCGAPFVGLISDAVKTRRLPLTLSATVTAILLSIVLYVPNLHIQTLFVILFIFGLFSSAQVLVFSISRELSPTILVGTAIGTTNMIVMLSGASISLMGFLLNLSWKTGAAPITLYTWNYQLALAILPLSLLAAVFLTFYLPETYCRPFGLLSSSEVLD